MASVAAPITQGCVAEHQQVTQILMPTAGEVLAEGRETSDFNIPPVSNHLAKHRKPGSDEEFGHYLAGLIEGDGHVGERNIVITFHSADVSAAYYIKKRIGYGIVSKVPGALTVRYQATHVCAREYIYRCINGKLIGAAKIEQFRRHKYEEKFNLPLRGLAPFSLTNHWLAGFADAAGCFSIGFRACGIRIKFHISQKHRFLLDSIHDVLGGAVYTAGTNAYQLQYSSAVQQKAVAAYFDEYHLQNPNQIIRYIK